MLKHSVHLHGYPISFTDGRCLIGCQAGVTVRLRQCDGWTSLFLWFYSICSSCLFQPPFLPLLASDTRLNTLLQCSFHISFAINFFLSKLVPLNDGVRFNVSVCVVITVWFFLLKGWLTPWNINKDWALDTKVNALLKSWNNISCVQLLHLLVWSRSIISWLGIDHINVFVKNVNV